MVVHFLLGAPGVWLLRESGEMVLDFARDWRLWREVGGGKEMSIDKVELSLVYQEVGLNYA